MAGLQLTALCEILSSHGFPALLDGENRFVRSVNTLEDACEGELSFLSNPKYASSLKVTKASAVIAKGDVAMPNGTAAIRCDDPYGAITAAIITIHGRRKHPCWGVHPASSIDPSARIGSNANIASGVTISADVLLGENSTIYPGCYIGSGARIGTDCTLFPNVVIYDGSIVGDRVTIHAGAVIGQDGLGYAPQGTKWVKIPQVGHTVIGDDVEIGANCAIDRATLGKTEIGSGTKFGNVVVVGHGTKIGPDCMIVGLVGIAGSVTVGRHVTLAGQVGIAGHLNVGDNVTVAAQSGIINDIESNLTVLGSPAMAAIPAKRSLAAVTKLPEYIRRIRDLEHEVERLRAMIEGNARVP